MKLKSLLIVVKDIERSRQFYHDLFGLELVLDNDGNMILTEGLVLQEEKYSGDHRLMHQFLFDVLPGGFVKTQQGSFSILFLFVLLF